MKISDLQFGKSYRVTLAPVARGVFVAQMQSHTTDTVVWDNGMIIAGLTEIDAVETTAVTGESAPTKHASENWLRLQGVIIAAGILAFLWLVRVIVLFVLALIAMGQYG